MSKAFKLKVGYTVRIKITAADADDVPTDAPGKLVFISSKPHVLRVFQATDDPYSLVLDGVTPGRAMVSAKMGKLMKRKWIVVE